MKTTITVRLDERQQKALSHAARRLRKSTSDIVREALDHALFQGTVAARAGHVKGRIRSLSIGRTGWRSALKDRNWRP